jgi:hypothetical protein
MVNLRLNINRDFERNSQTSFISRFNRNGFICYKCNNKIKEYKEIEFYQAKFLHSDC